MTAFLPAKLPAAVHARAGSTAAALAATFPGVPESARAGRAFARSALGPDHPAAEVAVLCVSELITNAVLHSRSGLSGGQVTVTVQPEPDGVLIRVRDGGSRCAPHLAAESVGLDEHGNGLRLVDVLTDEWGSFGGPLGRTVWFRCGGDL